MQPVQVADCESGLLELVCLERPLNFQSNDLTVQNSDERQVASHRN